MFLTVTVSESCGGGGGGGGGGGELHVLSCVTSR